MSKLELFFCENLTSQQVLRGNPWDFTATEIISKEVCEDKSKRDEWYKLQTTRHCFYSGIGGINNTMRVSGKNPPFEMVALCVDCDAVSFDEKRILKICESKKMIRPPNYIEKSLGGKTHYVWLLEKPIKLGSADIATLIQQKLAEFVNARRFPGIDEGALKETTRMFCRGKEPWIKIHDNPLPAQEIEPLCREWISAYYSKKSSADIPLNEVEQELKRKFSNFSWPEEFREETAGPSFWIEGSTSPRSAILKKGGFYTFSGHATKSFYDWDDLLGKDFTERWKTAKIDDVIKGVWWDGKYVWRWMDKQNLPEGETSEGYHSQQPPEFAAHLNVDRGLSFASRKGEPSMIDKALNEVRKRLVDGVAPFVCHADRLVNLNGEVYLNTYERRCVIPAEDPQVWGTDGNFPWLSNLLDKFFDPPEQLPVLLFWTKRFYHNVLENLVTRGQMLALAGAVGCGKTLLSQVIIGGLVGGSADASTYMTGVERFGAHLFKHPLWCVDDELMGNDSITKRNFTAMSKKIVANDRLPYDKKFHHSLQVLWCGRVILTLNVDESSIESLPYLDASNLDKIIILRTVKKPPIFYPPKEEIVEIVNRELPFFARWLLDWKPPAELVGENRFGLKPFHEESVVDKANQSLPHTAFEILLARVVREWFVEKPNIAKSEWRGDMWKAFDLISAVPSAQGQFKAQQINRFMQQIARSGRRLRMRSEGDTWIIERPEDV